MERKDCLRTKEYAEWASPQLTQRLLGLRKPRLNEVLQVFTGHCNLYKHRKTIGYDASSTCPKCNLEEETPNHRVGECNYYQDLRKKVFGSEKKHNKVGSQKTKYKPNDKVPEDLLNTASCSSSINQIAVIVVMGLNNGLHNVPVKIDAGESSLWHHRPLIIIIAQAHHDVYRFVTVLLVSVQLLFYVFLIFIISWLKDINY